MHDPASIQICYLEFVALFNVFRAENLQHVEIKWVGTGENELPWEPNLFIEVGVFPMELLAYQVQWSVMQIGQDSFINIHHILLRF